VLRTAQSGTNGVSLGGGGRVTHARCADTGRGDARQRPDGVLDLVAVVVCAAHDDHLLGAPRQKEPPAPQEAEVAYRRGRGCR